jgi:hypothetical protein
MKMRDAFFSLPLVGRVGERERAGVGVFKKHHPCGTFTATSAPPLDRRFAQSRCKASAFCFLRTATEGRLCTLPTLSRGRDKKDAPLYAIALCKIGETAMSSMI